MSRVYTLLFAIIAGVCIVLAVMNHAQGDRFMFALDSMLAPLFTVLAAREDWASKKE